MSDLTLLEGFRYSPADRRALDAYRRAQEDPPTRSKAIRDILRQALRKYFAPAHNQAADTQGGVAT
jgi:metal-responsive CopG/Arc/MetJ family transcriptional regulator